MPRAALIGTLAASAVIAAGACDMRPEGMPPAGARPPIRVSVGPVPGPADTAMAPTPGNPLAGRDDARTDGRRLFVQFNCAGCHGGHGGGGMGPSLRDPEWIYGNSEGHIFDSIAAGRANGMPAWGTHLPSEQIWKLVAYIQSMRTDDEPQPPR